MLIEFLLGGDRIAEVEGEVHRAQNGDLGAGMAAGLVGEFGEQRLSVRSALLPGDRHRLDDLRRQPAAGDYAPLRQHFGEAKITELHRRRRGGKQDVRIRCEVGFHGEDRPSHQVSRIGRALSGEFGGDAPAQPPHPQGPAAAHLAEQRVCQPHGRGLHLRVDADQAE